MKEEVKRLLYLRKEVDNIIDNYISEYVLRGKEFDTNLLRDSLIYHIDDNLNALKQGR